MRWLGLLALASLGLSGCGEDVIGKADPSFELEPAKIDFGTVELGQQKTITAILKNIATIRGELLKVEIEDDCEACIVVFAETGRIDSLGERPVDVRFRAVRLEVATATITLTTDDPNNEFLEIHVFGRGSDTRAPDIEVEPERIDFGFVPAGGVALSSFVIRSTGTNDLLIDRISIDPPDAPFKITTSTPSPERPGQMEPGAQASVSLRASLPATQTGTATARILIETNVLEEKNVPGRRGVVAIPLSAVANLPPIAVVDPMQTVEPWSRVTLDGSKSYDQDNPPDEPLSFRWELVSAAPGSTTRLERASTPNPSFWVDVTGEYEVRLVVTDAIGLESDPVTTVIEALPTNVVRIELTWDHPDSDLDLHLVREGGAFCDCATDVHYRDCGRTPNWFPNAPGANPRLDIDDRSGFGPENINIDGDGVERYIPDGRYQIQVHYFASNAGVSSWPTSTSRATVRVFIYGLLAAELSQDMVLDGDVWVAGEIRWPEREVVPIGRYSSGNVCSVF